MMSRSPYFSIITPTYNRASFLEEMAASVGAQTFQDYEHIIVDDGSTDGTEVLIKQLMQTHPKIVYIKQENKGRSTARNLGIEAAKGEFVCFLDSDDVWLPNHLELLRKVSIDQKTPAFFHTGLIWFYDNGTADHLVKYGNRSQFFSSVEYVIANEFAPDCVCVHHAILKKHRFNPALFINEDIELWARIATEYPVIGVEQHTAKLRVHAGNTHVEVEDDVSPRRDAFSIMMANSDVRKELSTTFIRNRKRSLAELEIRYLDGTEQRGLLVKKLAVFLLKYPETSRNSAKMVSLLYNLPGGQVLKKLVAVTKTRSVE